MCTDEVSFQVRGYELDSLGHLNNSIYLNYLEEARWEFFRDKDIITQRGNAKDKFGLYLVVIENSIRYLHELLLFDEVSIITDYSYDGIYLVTKSVYVRKRDNKKVAHASSKLVFVDKDRSVYDIPNEIKDILGGSYDK